MPDQTELLMQVIDAHMRGIRTELSQLKESSENGYQEIMGMFEKAFPDGDLAGHMKFHQQLIDDARTRREIRNEILKKLVAGSAWSTLLFFGYKAIDWFKEYFHVFPK